MSFSPRAGHLSTQLAAHVSDLDDNAATRRDGLALARDVAATKGGDVKPRVLAARENAARDRRAAAHNRQRAAADRGASWSDRSASAGERVVLSFDGLTGAYRRDTGLIERRLLRIGSPLFHFGILGVFAGHVVGLGCRRPGRRRSGCPKACTTSWP